MANQFNIVFMGTPDFAVPSLKALKENGYNISLVITQPDQPKGRGRKISPPPIRVAAEKIGIPISQTDAVKSDEFYQKIIQLHPDLLVVVAFGHIIPKKILDIPVFGAVNVHASLLPKYRGPAPIQWAIINGETVTGVTTMVMDKGLDTGGILLSSKVLITPNDTAGTLGNRLSFSGADLLVKTIQKMKEGSLRPMSQNHAEATYAPMLKKNDGHVDWKRPADEIERFIRGVNPWPGAFTFINDKRLRIYAAKPLEVKTSEVPGRVIKGLSNELCIATGKGAIALLEVQSESGKHMQIDTFLRGHPIPAGALLT